MQFTLLKNFINNNTEYKTSEIKSINNHSYFIADDGDEGYEVIQDSINNYKIKEIMGDFSIDVCKVNSFKECVLFFV